MPYSSREDIFNTLSETTARKYASDSSTDTADQQNTRIDAALSKAAERIDGYLRSVYSLPLASVPGILRDLSTDIAVYFLATRKGIKKDSPEENLVKKFNDAMAYLRDIQKGAADIGVIGSDPTESRPNRAATVKASPRRFDDDFFRGYD